MSNIQPIVFSVFPLMLPFILLFIFLLYLKLFSWLGNIRPYIRARKVFRKKRNIPLFIWIADEPSIDVLMYEILKNLKTTTNFKKDLQIIKTRVEEYIGEDLSDYLLIKEILNQRLSSGIETMIRGSIKTTFTSIITSAVTTLVINKLEINYFNALYTFLWIFIIIMTAFFIYNFYFTRQRNRIEILIIILDLIIKDKFE